ncbi:MAG: hypothetical protein BGO98_15500 [Myxococcales bacterium 68-20]|nr:MAG: hypothetical protein BGO98_15500 [Myxococcales bacterium 68-20]
MTGRAPMNRDATPSRTLVDAGRGRAESEPPPERRSGRVRELVRRVRASVGASAWAGLVGRALLFVVGLVVLAWIGRVATAAPAQANPLHHESASDAGAASLAARAIAALPAPPTPPPPAAAPTPVPPAPPPPATSSARATPEDPVYVNHASAEELRRLPGVGPKRAEGIIALRQRMGRFQRIEDLLRVKGVGRATLRKWRPLVRLDAPARSDGVPALDGGAP